MKRAFTLHRTLGRALAGVLLFVLLTGSLAAISIDLEALVEQGGSTSLTTEAFDAFETAEQARGETVVRLILPTEERGAWALVRRHGTFERATLNDDGTVRARLPRIGAVQALRDIHRELLLGHVGLYFVTPTSILLLALLITGLLSQRRFIWKPHGTQHEARLSSWHRMLGTYAFVPGLLFAMTGIFYIAETVVEDAGGTLEMEPPQGEVSDSSCNPCMTLCDVMRLVHDASPHLSPREIAFSRDGNVLTVFGPGRAPLVRDIGSYVVVDRRQGRVLGAHEAGASHPLDLTADVVDTLHFGRFGGTFMRALWCLFGLMLVGLAASGWMRATGREGFQREALVLLIVLIGLITRGVFRSWSELAPSGFIALGVLLLSAVATFALVATTQRKSAAGRGSSRTNVNQ